MNKCYLASEKALIDWLATQAKDKQVFAPKQVAASVLYAAMSPEMLEKTKETGLLLERATLSAKHLVIPQSEELFSFCAKKNPENLASTQIALTVAKEAEEKLLFAARPCDARGIAELDAIYLEGQFKDPYYAARREALTIITLTCNIPCPTCFCHFLSKDGPAAKEGSDILMTQIGAGFVLEAITEKGAKLLENAPFEDAKEHLETVQKTRAYGLEQMGEAVDLSIAPQRLKDRFTDIDFWTEQTAKCLSCGACTHMCPTCQCFNITDEGDTLEGRRVRSWDSCMSAVFTREASAHNPRPTKAMRMRNRISHKYWYIPENSRGLREGLWGCTGCGRCIRQCPVAFDICEVLLKAIKDD